MDVLAGRSRRRPILVRQRRILASAGTIAESWIGRPPWVAMQILRHSQIAVTMDT